MFRLVAFLSCALLMTFVSCKKSDSNEAAMILESQISFDIDGKSVVWSGEKNAKGGLNIRGVRIKRPATENTLSYVFYANQDDSNGGQFSIYTDSLIPKIYHQRDPSPTQFHINNNQYGGGFISEYIDFVITSHKNGVVNGTFSGKVLGSTGGLVSISNGVLKDIRIFYP